LQKEQGVMDEQNHYSATQFSKHKCPYTHHLFNSSEAEIRTQCLHTSAFISSAHQKCFASCISSAVQRSGSPEMEGQGCMVYGEDIPSKIHPGVAIWKQKWSRSIITFLSKPGHYPEGFFHEQHHCAAVFWIHCCIVA
jgi:hypothetical protein